MKSSEFNDRKTLIVGYPGRLSQAFAQRWPQAQRVGKKQFDVTKRDETLYEICHIRPKIVINCAALTDMRRCEADRDLAWNVNVRGVRHLAEACNNIGALLVHFSSDLAANPTNEYAWTKRSSESIAPLTVRAKLYDASHWAWVALRNNREVRMLVNEFLNPISTTGVAEITEELLQKKVRGLISIGTEERLSFWQVGTKWAECLGVSRELVIPVETIDSTFPRTKEMFLDTTDLRCLGIQIPNLDDDAHRHWASFRELQCP